MSNAQLKAIVREAHRRDIEFKFTRERYNWMVSRTIEARKAYEEVMADAIAKKMPPTAHRNFSYTKNLLNKWSRWTQAMDTILSREEFIEYEKKKGRVFSWNDMAVYAKTGEPVEVDKNADETLGEVY